MKKAYFIDLDNTIYFTKPNATVLLGGLYQILEGEELGLSAAAFAEAKEEMLKIPFLKVAAKYNFSNEVIERALAFLNEDEVLVPLQTHDEYHYLKALDGLKFIVTAGFERKQLSKLNMLGIAKDFKEVIVVDVSKGTKKEAFITLLEKYKLAIANVLVIGDDVDSEIKFGLELGLDTFLFDPGEKYPEAKTTYRATTFKNIGGI